MVGRGELTDKAWEQIVPLLPENGRRGQQWKDHRKVINGILWKLMTGAPWRDLPECYGPWQTCYDRFVRWRRDAVPGRGFLPTPERRATRAGRRWRGRLAWTPPWCAPTSTPRAPGGDPANKTQKGAFAPPGREALGSSRGGLTTELRLP